MIYALKPTVAAVAGVLTFAEDGSPAHPFTDFQSAMLAAAAGEQVGLTGSLATDPWQGRAIDYTGVTLMPQGTARQYLTDSIDLSHGAIWRRHEHYFDGQSTNGGGFFSNNLGTVSLNAVDTLFAPNNVHIASAGGLRTGGTNNLRMAAGQKFRVRILGIAETDGLGWRLKNLGTGHWLAPATDTWGADSNYTDAITSSVDGQEYVSPWCSAEDTQIFEWTIGAKSGDSGFVERAFIEHMAEWAVHDAANRIYKVHLHNQDSTRVIKHFYVSKTPFDFSDSDSWVPAEEAASIAALKPGQFIHHYVDQTTAGEAMLYYRLAADETDITALHFRAVRPDAALITALGENSIQANLCLTANYRGIERKGTSTGKILDVDINRSITDWVFTRDTANVVQIGGRLRDCLGVSGGLHGDGILTSGTGVYTGIGVDGRRCGDEIFQVNEDGTATCYGCYGEDSGLVEGSGGNCLSIEGGDGDSPTLAWYGGALKQNAGRAAAVVRDGVGGTAVGTLTLKDACLIQGGTGPIYNDGGSTTTFANLHHGGDGQYADTINSLTSTLIDIAEHLETVNDVPVLKRTSNLLGTASLWEAAGSANLIGADGQVYAPPPHRDPLFQTPHHLLHPLYE